jgi:hypothetical protein
MTKQQVDKRIGFFEYHGRRILLVDFSNCTAREAEEITRRVPDYVTREPLGSVLILTNFAGGSFDRAALNAMKETAVFDKPYVNKSALIGTLSLPREFQDEMQTYSRRAFALFPTREDALKWLVD